MKYEFDPNGEYMQKGYWGTHTPDDHCAHTRLPKPLPGTIRVIRQFWAERAPGKLATNTLTDFIRLPSRQLVRRLKEGEAFIGGSHPIGSIVKFEEEELFLEFKSKSILPYTSDPKYIRRTYWGVVSQIDYPQPNRIILMRISEGFVHFGMGMVEGTRFFKHDPTLEVGKVLHTRMAENENWAFSESFSRVLSAEIWAIGKGVRKPVKERPFKSFLGKLIPHLDSTLKYSSNS